MAKLVFCNRVRLLSLLAKVTSQSWLICSTAHLKYLFNLVKFVIIKLLLCFAIVSYLVCAVSEFLYTSRSYFYFIVFFTNATFKVVLQAVCEWHCCSQQKAAKLSLTFELANSTKQHNWRLHTQVCCWFVWSDIYAPASSTSWVPFS